MSVDQGNYEYPENLLSSLNNLQEQKQLCDIVINVGGRSFHAHKNVLAASCSYFLAMLTSGFKESTQNEININGKAETFEILLKFAYTGRLKITSKTAYDVLDMACYMQFKDLSVTCYELIIKLYYHESERISVSDALQICMMARNHDHLAHLAKMSEKYLVDYVKELKTTDVFLQNASVEFLEDFLSRDELSSEEEEIEVLEMVVNWLMHDWENRQDNAHQLLQKVRLGLVPSKSLLEVVGSEMLEIPECKELLDGVLQQQASTKSKTVLSLENPELFTTRSTITAPIHMEGIDPILLIGDMINCRFHYFNTKQHEWLTLYEFPVPPSTANSSLLVVEGVLFSAGGITPFSEQEGAFICQESFYCYHAEENKWSELPPMIKPRCHFPLVYLDGFIYAIGGLEDVNSSSRVATTDHVERYDMAKKEWEQVAKLPKKYIRMSAVAHRGVIIVCGKLHNSADSEYDQYDLLLYRPDTNVWGKNSACTEHQIKYARPPMLFLHKDECYRIMYLANTALMNYHPPSVNKVDFQKQGDDDEVTVAVGVEVKQDNIPEHDDLDVSVFRVEDEVFVHDTPFVYSTGIKNGQDQKDGVDLNEWGRFYFPKECRGYDIPVIHNTTLFTFDRKRLAFAKRSPREATF